MIEPNKDSIGSVPGRHHSSRRPSCSLTLQRGDVTVFVGANGTRQCIRAGLFDERHVALISLLLGDGLRLIEAPGSGPIDVERRREVETDWPGHPGATYLVFSAVI